MVEGPLLVLYYLHAMLGAVAFALTVAAVLVGVDADLPVHCVHSQVLGEWKLHRGPGQQVKTSLKCSQAPVLLYPPPPPCIASDLMWCCRRCTTSGSIGTGSGHPTSPRRTP